MESVGVVCPRCGTVNRAAAPFCKSCVAPLTSGELQAPGYDAEPTQWLAHGTDGDVPGEAFARTVVLGLGDQALASGSLIEGFRIQRTIGEGGFGVVYLARDEALERNVAIKEYMPMALAVRDVNTQQIGVRSQRDRTTFEAGLRSFVNEARLLARFDHPSLVKVLRYWEANGTAYMAMPFYEGPTLRISLASQRTRATEAQMRAWLDPLLDALVVLHRENCFHRDIAPDNILLTASGPVLLDFGAARRAIGDRTQVFTTMLKPGFAPIEQYGSEMLQGAWTDLYALAGVVHYALTGRPPVASVQRVVRDTQASLSKTCAGRYSESFLGAMDAALSVRPEARPQDVAAFRALLAGQVAAPPVILAAPAAVLAPVPVPMPVSATVRSDEPSGGPGEAVAEAVVAPLATDTAPQVPTPVAAAPSLPPAPAGAAPPRPAAPRQNMLTVLVAAAALAASAVAVVIWWPASGTADPATVPPRAGIAGAPALAPPLAAERAPAPVPPPAAVAAQAPTATVEPAAASAPPAQAKPALAAASQSPASSPSPAPPPEITVSIATPTDSATNAPPRSRVAKPVRANAPAPLAVHDTQPAKLSENDTKEANSYIDAGRPPRCGDLVLKSSFEPLNPQEIAFLKSKCR